MSEDIQKLLSLDNAVFRAYLFYSSILIMKMLLMAVLTGRQRYAKKIFITPEDTTLLKGSKHGVQDPDIERVRRAHLNDLENILIYFVAAFGYLLTNPSAALAVMLMRLYTIARIIHTIVYAVVVVPQPTRGIAWAVGYVITGYMAIVTAIKYAS